MQYKNTTIALNKISFGSRGVVEPLCNSCKTKDCTHHIENKNVSIFGSIKKYRLLMSASNPMCVVSCEGYTL